MRKSILWYIGETQLIDWETVQRNRVRIPFLREKQVLVWAVRLVLAAYLLNSSVSPVLAVTHDDSESIIPEFYVSFKGNGAGTPKLGVNFNAYQVYNGSTPNHLSEYIESGETNGDPSGVIWTNFSVYVKNGMPLDLYGALVVTGQNIGEYKIFINTPDTKYQSYVNAIEQRLIDQVVTSGSTLPVTNYVLFKRVGDNGGVAGKVASVMPGWLNFKLSLGNGKFGGPLGYLTFLWGNQISLPDTSQEVTVTNYVDDNNVSHSQLYAPQMNMDMYWSNTYTAGDGFNQGAYIINCFDNASQAGSPTTSGGVSYINYSGVTPAISYYLSYSNNLAGSSDAIYKTKLKRVEGSTVMDALAQQLMNVSQGEYLPLCVPPVCFTFVDPMSGAEWQECTPGSCLIQWLVLPSVSQSDYSFDWATNGMTGSRNCRGDGVAYYCAPGASSPTEYYSTNIVGLGAYGSFGPTRADSGRLELSSSFDNISSSNLFWPGISIQQDSVGTRSNFNGSATYCFNPGSGSHLKLTNNVDPNGSWTCYEYYDDINERGMVRRITKPYTNYPATPSPHSAGSLVTEYTYTNNWDGSLTLPAQVVTRLKSSSSTNDSTSDTVISRTTYDYSASTNSGSEVVYANMGIWITERHDYYDANNYTRTVIKQIRPDAARMMANLPFSVENPDGSKIAYNYEAGSLDVNDSFTPNTSVTPIVMLTTPSLYPTAATRVWKIYCTTNASDPNAVALFGDSRMGFDAAYAIPFKTTAELETRDQYGRLVRVDTIACNGSSSGVATFNFTTPIQSERHVYDASGNLTASYELISGNWVLVYAAVYTDSSGNPTGRKQYEQDRTGTIRHFVYDDYGRVTNTITLQANTALLGGLVPPQTQTFYTFDTDGRTLSTIVGTSPTDPNALVTSNIYNLAGLPLLEVTPGGYAKTNDYSHEASRYVTETMLGRGNASYNRTIVTSNYLDGRIQSISGTAVVPKCWLYSIQDQGTVTLSDGSTANAGFPSTTVSQGTAGPAPTSRTIVTNMDWLGHVTNTITANPSELPGPGNLVTSYNYNNLGQLVSTVVGDLAPVVNVYDSFGQLFRSGMSLSGSLTALNPSSMDRISEQNTALIQDASGAWWQASTNIVYPNNNSATQLIINQTYKRCAPVLTTIPTWDLGLGDSDTFIWDTCVSNIDASGNWTVENTLYDPEYALTYTEEDSSLTGGASILSGNTSESTYGWASKTLSVNGAQVYGVNAHNNTQTYLSYDTYGRQTNSITGMLTSTYAQTNSLTYRQGSTEVNWQQNGDNTWVETLFDPAGRLASNVVFNTSSSTAPTTGGKVTQCEYNLRGQVVHVWGNVPYPLENLYYTNGMGGVYTPELEGQIYEKRLFGGGTSWAPSTSWPGSSATPSDTETYLYNAQNGLLHTKNGSVGNDIYTYNQRGNLLTRTTSRGVETQYSYNEAAGANTGELIGITYSGDPSGVNDPSISYAYNRLGVLTNVTDACGSRSYYYRSSDQQMDHQTLPSIYGTGLELGLNYDSLSRISGYWLGTSASSAPVSTVYNYYDTDASDRSGRLKSISSPLSTPSGSFTYTYLPNSPYISSISGPSLGARGALLLTNIYSITTNILVTSSNLLGTTNLATYDCRYDDLHRLQKFGQSGLLYSYYGAGLAAGLAYDDRNELIGSTNYLTGSPDSISGSTTKLPRRGFSYSYDNIGDRSDTVVDTDPPLPYTVNSGLQYHERINPAFVEVDGLVNANTTLTATRGGSKFNLTQVTLGASQLAVGGSASYFYGTTNRYNNGAAVQPITLNSTLTLNSSTAATGTETRNVVLRPISEYFGYDQCGDLTVDGLWQYTYDDENRIKRIQTLPALLGVSGMPNVSVSFLYDFLGRRVQKTLSNYVNSAWVAASTNVYVYDGLNLIADYSKGGSGTLTLNNSYYWGLDKSGSMQGGGVGGLLGMVTHATFPLGKYAALNDPWGNVVGMFDLAVGIPVAEYEYSPFGETLRAMGTMATNNPFGFSTKYHDQETGLLNFGYRYYSPGLGRFMNGDPKDELGRLEMLAPLQAGGMPVWSYIDALVGSPGKSPDLTPSTPAGLAQSNERQDGGFHNSTSPGNIFDHRKDSGSSGGGNYRPGPPYRPSLAGADNPYGFVGNNPYGGIDPLGLWTWGGVMDSVSDFFGFGDYQYGAENTMASTFPNITGSTYTSMNPGFGFQGEMGFYTYDAGTPFDGFIDFESSAYNSFLNGYSEQNGYAKFDATVDVLEYDFNIGVQRVGETALNIVGAGLDAAGQVAMSYPQSAEIAPELQATAAFFKDLAPATSIVAETAPAAEETAVATETTQIGAGAPDFIVTPNGEAIPVPGGAVGPTPTQSPGFQFNGGTGGNGLAPNVTDVRIMEPNAQNPSGYVNYGSQQVNGGWQSVNPYTGQAISPTSPWWHIPINQ